MCMYCHGYYYTYARVLQLEARNFMTDLPLPNSRMYKFDEAREMGNSGSDRKDILSPGNFLDIYIHIGYLYLQERKIFNF